MTLWTQATTSALPAPNVRRAAESATPSVILPPGAPPSAAHRASAELPLGRPRGDVILTAWMNISVGSGLGWLSPSMAIGPLGWTCGSSCRICGG
jgi:hypothetical protein